MVRETAKHSLRSYFKEEMTIQNKYRNRKVIVDGIKFDSNGEAKRYQELCLLQKAGEISGLRLQVPYYINYQGKLICKFIADFVYIENGEEIVEDFKGYKGNSTYRLKKKLMKVIMGIEIKEA